MDEEADGRTAGGVGLDAGFRHGTAVVGSDDDLLLDALPFVEDGLRAGDLVAMACPPETATLVCDALGEVGVGLENDPGLTLLGARAPDAIGRARGYVERAAEHPSGRLRILSEVDFGDHPTGWREGQRFESACSRLMAGTAISALCVYDRRRLPAEVLATATATHPHVVRGGAWATNPAFQDPARYIRSLPAPHEPVEDTVPVLTVDDAPTLAGLRHQIGAVLTAHVPDAEQRADLHLATSEVAANAFRHGRRPISARVWTDGDRMVCAITDSGHRFDDPLAGFRPAHGDDLSRGGMGLWLARKLWDSVDLLRGPAGLTVRLSTWLH
ncbi:sensor histidine kinase [Geodermatophilus sabuli]|uniref:sensor histidine kinase n=1 Tax=Geodermatophilus sabuli TaxID=1564158 RepID=UPI00117B6743|nr:sensor histidine kinase [Geodermatophilus sabuli]MBB3086378.1 anti-sigma regulatory factor (Ser/Thr protein kinase) [Geodermatophilus sabuli]